MSVRKEARQSSANANGLVSACRHELVKNWPAVNIEFRSINSVIFYARNARTHSDAQVTQIAASMREFGWTTPCLVDETGLLIAGHGRVLAAKLLGFSEVPVMVATGWSEAKRRAYTLADNKLALNAGWDNAMLAVELNDLEAAAFDMSLIGFSVDEMTELTADKQVGLTDPDEVPEPPTVPTTRHGDVWICGEHSILCGDATVLTEMEHLMGGDIADMAFTDPPYNVNYANNPKDKQRGTSRPILNDALGDAFGAFLHEASKNILASTKGAVYICMSSSELDTLQRAFRGAGGKWSTFLIWAKSSFTIGRSDYQRQYEPILYGCRDGSDHFWCGARNQ